MNKQEFLAASLPYGLKYYPFDGNRITEHICLIAEYRHDEFTIADNEKEYYLELKDMIPIIRPLDSLTKECVQADYNDGKPFVPIIELLEIELEKSVCRKYWKPDASHIEWKAVAWKAVNRTSCFGYNKRGAFFHTECGEYQYLYNYEKLFQQLLKWHFWPNMPEGEEVVYVSDNFNPYK